MTPYGDRDQDQNLLMQRLVAWRHQTITWISVDSSTIRSRDIHLKIISQEILQPPTTKIMHLTLHTNLLLGQRVEEKSM